MNNQRITVYPDCRNERTYPTEYELLPSGIKLQINLGEICEPITYQAISNCFISPYGVVFKNGWLVMDSLYKMYPTRKNIFTFYKKIALGRVRRVTHPCLVAMNPFYDNYGHFLFECLPRIFAAKKLHNALCLVIPSKAPKFVLDYASLFDFKDIILLKETEVVYTPEAILPNSFNFGIQHYDLMRDLKQFLLSKITIPSKTTRILLSRDKAAHRKSNKEKDLFLQLEKLSFEKVFAEDLTVAEQIKVFSGCNYLVGIHSTGLNNCFYMPSNSNVVGIILKGHNDISVYNVSQVNKQKFSFLFADPCNHHPLINFDDPELDLESIVKFVEKTLVK